MEYEILDGSSFGNKIKSYMQKDPNLKAKLAIAFIGDGAIDLLGGGNLSNCQITCDYLSGGTNPNAVEVLKEAGAKVRHLDGLHAKIGVVGDKLSFVGSSNLSHNGMVANDRHERVVVFDGIEKTVKEHCADLWELSIEITDEMKQQAEDAWQLRRQHNAIRKYSQNQSNIIEVLKSDPDSLDALEVYIVVSEFITQEQEKEFNLGEEAIQEANDTNFEAYWDWEKLPKKGVFIDFYKPNRGNLGFNGLYERDAYKFKDIERNGDTFQAVLNVENIERIICDQEHANELKTYIQEYCNENPCKDDDNAYCFKISALEKYANKDA